MDQQILRRVAQPEEIEKSVCYLAEKMGAFLRRGDRVLICFDASEPSALGSIFAEAVRRRGALPTVWGPDYRWNTLLRQAFLLKAWAIIAPPLVVLGLTKLARAKGTPLYAHHVVTAGYPCTNWMIDGINNGLDCQTWGCLDYNCSGVVAGFSCPNIRGVHIRDEEFSAEIGESGELLLNFRDGAVLRTRDRARLDTTPCSCGCKSAKLLNIGYGADADMELLKLSEQINQWTSVLDCRLQRGINGLEIEIVVFPGEKLPTLPSCAKLVVRPWDPEKDSPFWVDAGWKNAFYDRKDH